MEMRNQIWSGRLRRRLAGTAAAVAALSLGLLLAGGAVGAGSWGLSFQEKGRAPVGTASADALAQYDAAYVGDDREPVIYLTFDAGYEGGQTARILDTLRAHQVPAAFFVVGHYLETEPDLVRRMANEGHTVGNHTYHHSDMASISDPEAFAEELRLVEEAYQDITGEPMARYYRPPQGVYSQENLEMAQSLGYRTVFWSLAYVDWLQDDQPTAEEAFAKLLPRIHNGAVVLLHATSETNAEILDELLTRWKEMGYTFGTLDQLFAGTD